MEGKMAAADIVFALTLAFLAGVLAASFRLALLSAAFLVAGFIALWFSLRGWKNAGVAAGAAGIFFFGIFYFHLWGAVKSEYDILPPPGAPFSAVIVSDPGPPSASVNFSVRLEPPYRGKIRILAFEAPPTSYGDRVELVGAQAESRKPFEPLWKAKIVNVTAEHQASAVRETLIAFKNKLADVAGKYFDARAASLLNGMILGKQGDFDPELKAQMASSGTTHLVALSGYNVGILAWSAFFLLSYFLPRRKAAPLVVLILAFFVAAVGAEASVVRSAVMAALAVAARFFGRPWEVGNAVAATAGGMTLLNPQVLRWDVGFQLSFLSLLGIVYLSEPLAGLFRFRKKDRAEMPPWKTNFLTTLAAQLGVVPLLLSYFGQFSLLAVVSNILILQLVPLTMLFGFLIAATGIVAEFLPVVFLLPTAVVLWFELLVISAFSAVRLPLPSFLASSGAFIAAYYAALIAFALFATRKNRPRPPALSLQPRPLRA